MFGTPIMDYSRRLQIARHGFESVTATLAQDYDRYEEIAERHGLEISERRVRRVVERASEEEPEQTSAWRRVLEQTTSVLLRQSRRGLLGFDLLHLLLLVSPQTWPEAEQSARSQSRKSEGNDRCDTFPDLFVEDLDQHLTDVDAENAESDNERCTDPASVEPDLLQQT